MVRLRLNIWLGLLATLPALPSAEQSQSCPININFSGNALTHWLAYTGNNKDGNGPTAIMRIYDSTAAAPNGTIGATSFPEYNLPSMTSIRVITSQGTDAFGNFPTIPTVNGYAYRYSILLGSTAVSRNQMTSPMEPPNGSPPPQTNAPPGGYVRGIRYLINVPSGPASVPYTMTYAYAMVLENGTHASIDQPMARAIVSTPGGVIDCASPEYFLPTNGGLDSGTARNNGFTPSPLPTPNPAPIPGGGPPQYLQDVWTKGWTEVTFDLSAYRGQQVSLTFEADNCVPGGHFAYAYFALRDVCAGLRISGDTIACSNATGKFSIPSLDGATYEWSIPPGWTLNPGSGGTSIDVTVGEKPGFIVAKEKNSCSTLTDSLFVYLYKGALPKAVIDPRDTTVCYGQPAPLHALILTGTKYIWQSHEPFGRGTSDSIVIPSVPFATGIVATPNQTADYILNIRNDGCPITVSDTFRVNIVPPIHIDLGNDTLVVVGEPLQFHAISTDPYRDEYQWSPSTDLNDPNIQNPIGLYPGDINTITYQVSATDSFGCYGTATVKVTIAHTLPDIFVPNAFTPAGSTNTLFRPVCIGIASLEYFRVYNRWGQMVFGTSQIGQGWDGRIHGQMQESNAYLWVAKGTDYTGKPISKRGTVVLVR